jgi:excisionase family DNA binding protein
MDNPFEMLQASIERMEARFMERMDQLSIPSAPMPISIDKLIGPDQLAKEINLQKSTILRYARNNTIPSYKSGNRYSFKLSEVTAALSSTAKIPKHKGVKI